MALEIGTTIPGSTDENVKVSENDTTAGKLINKVVSTDGSVQFSEQNDGADEKLNFIVDPSIASSIAVQNTNIIASGTAADLLEKTLSTYTLPAGSLANVGDGIHLHAHGRFGPTANNKILLLYWGAGSNGIVNTFNNLTWDIDFIIQRINVNSQISKLRIDVMDFAGIGGVAPTTRCDVGAGAENLANPIVIKITGQNTVAVLNDIRFDAWYIKLFKA